MTELKQHIVVVDAYRCPDRRRNAAGRYIVLAKNSKEAEQLVQNAIDFGNVQFLGYDTHMDYNLDYRQVIKIAPGGIIDKPRHACAYQKSENLPRKS